MRILNLYAGIGGNRTLWGDLHEVTAVEYDVNIAQVYTDRFPRDTLVVDNAHSYLREHYDEFDMIWSSPPCQSHGQYRYNVGVKAKGFEPLYPDMRLYEEVIFLTHHARALWVVENVQPYYAALIPPTVRLQRHLLWSNFDIPGREFNAKGIRTKNKISDYDDLGVDLSSYKGFDKRQVLRNMVDPDLGLHVMKAALTSVGQ